MSRWGLGVNCRWCILWPNLCHAEFSKCRRNYGPNKGFMPNLQQGKLPKAKQTTVAGPRASAQALCLTFSHQHQPSKSSLIVLQCWFSAKVDFGIFSQTIFLDVNYTFLCAYTSPGLGKTGKSWTWKRTGTAQWAHPTGETGTTGSQIRP